MDFTLSEEQQMLVTAFDGLLSKYRQAPHGVHGYVCYSREFQDELRDSGFVGVVSQAGFGLLEAAMLVEAAAACPVSVEAAASMMVGPLVGNEQGPVALAWQVGRPVRYLAQARTLCQFDGDDVLVCEVDDCDIEEIDSVAAYPLGKLRRVSSHAIRLVGDTASAIRNRALIGLAAESAGLMRGALESTVAYVKERQQYGQPLGHFQAIQHRLAECAQIVTASRWLALRAAYECQERPAALASLYVQDAMRKVIYDCHQFSGAMGLTLEFPLHLWTYRMKVLQGEAGGRAGQAATVARTTWHASNTARSSFSIEEEAA